MIDPIFVARKPNVVISLVGLLYLALAGFNLVHDFAYEGVTDWRWLGWLLLGIGFLLLARVPPGSFSERMAFPLGRAAYGISFAGLAWLLFLLLRN